MKIHVVSIFLTALAVVATAAPVHPAGTSRLTHQRMTVPKHKHTPPGKTVHMLGAKSKRATLLNPEPTLLPNTDARTLAWSRQADALAAEGQRQFELGNLAPAESSFRQAFNLNNQDPKALSGLAQTLEREGKNQEAVQAYRVLIYPKRGWGTSLEGDPILRTHLALLLAASDQWPEALQVYEATLATINWGSSRPALDIHFDTGIAQPRLLAAMAHIVLGIEHDNRMEHPEDLFEYAEARRLQPDLAITNFYFGYGLKKLGRVGEAKQAFAEAAQSGTGDVRRMAEKELR